VTRWYYRGEWISEGTPNAEKYKRWIRWVQLYMLAKELHALPGSGGLFDQDFLYVEIFTVIAAVWISEENRHGEKVQQR